MGRAPGITTIILLIASIGIIVSVPVGCPSGKDSTGLPSPEPADKGHPKLDSQLNQLVRAERRGEATSFAEQHNIELVDGAVRVIIECTPEQLESAAKAVTDAGAKLETSYGDLLQVVVPITSLTTLADLPAIRFIRLPQRPLP